MGTETGHRYKTKKKKKKSEKNYKWPTLPGTLKWIVLCTFCHLSTAQLRDATQMGDAKRTHTRTRKVV